MILDPEVRSKVLKIFKTYNSLEEYSVKIYKIDPYFYECYEKHLKADDNEHKYIPFKIDIYFSDYSLAAEIDKKGVHRDLMFEVKRQKALEKKLNCKYIKINKINDLDYELSNIHSFIDEFKNNKIKELENKNPQSLQKKNNNYNTVLLENLNYKMLKLLEFLSPKK